MPPGNSKQHGGGGGGCSINTNHIISGGGGSSAGSYIPTEGAAGKVVEEYWKSVCKKCQLWFAVTPKRKSRRKHLVQFWL